MVSEHSFNSHKRQQSSESVTLGFTALKKPNTQTQNWTFMCTASSCLSKYDANVFFFLLSTSLQSVQCSREPLYFIASNNFTSPELTAWTDGGISKKGNMDYTEYEREEIHNRVPGLNCY